MTANAQRRPFRIASVAVPLSPLELVAVALMAPIFVSAALFYTYDISVTSLTLEIYRHFNAPFLIAEALVIAYAYVAGFRLSHAWLALARAERAAVIVFLATFWLAGVYVSAMPAFAAFFNMAFLLHVLFAAAVTHLVWQSRDRHIGELTRIFVLCLAVFTVLIAIKFMFPPTDRPIETIIWQFAIPGMISARLLGALLAPFVVLFCADAISSWHDREQRTWALCGAILTSGVLAWTGTRAGVLAAAVAMAIYAFYFRVRILKAPFVVTGFCCVAGALVGMALVPYNQADFLLFAPGDLDSADSITSLRSSWWLALVQAYFHNPIVGFGPGSSSYLAGPGFAPHVQPHNFILEFLLNWGAIAGCAALYLLSRTVRGSHRLARANPSAIPFVLMADALLVVGLFDGTLHFAQHLMLFAAALGIAFGFGRQPTVAGGTAEHFE